MIVVAVACYASVDIARSDDSERAKDGTGQCDEKDLRVAVQALTVPGEFVSKQGFCDYLRECGKSPKTCEESNELGSTDKL